MAVKIIWAASWQNQQKDLCTQRRLRSARASAQSDQESSLCAQWVAKDPSFLHADSKDWPDWADAQAYLSLRWAQMPFVGFCHEVAHFVISLHERLCGRNGFELKTPGLKSDYKSSKLPTLRPGPMKNSTVIQAMSQENLSSGFATS